MMSEDINYNSKNEEQIVNYENHEEPLNDSVFAEENLELTESKKLFSFVTKKKMFVFFSILIVTILLITTSFNFGYIAFSIAYNTRNYDLATEVLNWSFNSEQTNSNVKSFVSDKSKKAYQDFLDKKITFNEAKKQLQTAAKFYKNKQIVEKLNKLQESRVAFKIAQKHEEKGKIFEGLIEYTKVIEADKNNYATAQLKINALKDKATSTLENYIANNNFEDGLQFIEKLEKLFDSDFDSYKEKLNNIKREHDKQMAKEKRTLEIVSISFYTPDPPIFGDIAIIVVKNISSNIFSKAAIAFLFFDKDGYPVKPNQDHFEGWVQFPNSAAGGIDEIIRPGETATLKFALYSHTIEKIKACGLGYYNMNGEFILDEYVRYWIEDEYDRY